MRIINKIAVTTIALSYLMIGSAYVYGQAKHKELHNKKKHEISIGFKTGKGILFNTASESKKSFKKRYLSTNSVVVNKTICSHFKVEGAINYNTLQGRLPGQSNNFLNSSNPYSLSIPATIQYYFVQGKRRVNPYCGVGFQYNFNLNKNSVPPLNNEGGNIYNQINEAQGTKHINVLFTQGMSFEINTKIQVTEAIHFMPSSTDNFIGVDLGIGYKIP